MGYLCDVDTLCSDALTSDGKVGESVGVTNRLMTTISTYLQHNNETAIRTAWKFLGPPMLDRRHSQRAMG